MVANSRAANIAEAAWAESRSSRSRSSARRIGLWSSSFSTTRAPTISFCTRSGTAASACDPAVGPEPQHAVLEGLVDHRVAARVGLAVVERQDAVVHPLEQGDLVVLPLVAAQQQHELLGAEEVDGDLGDRRLHLGRDRASRGAGRSRRRGSSAGPPWCSESTSREASSLTSDSAVASRRSSSATRSPALALAPPSAASRRFDSTTRTSSPARSSVERSSPTSSSPAAGGVQPRLRRFGGVFLCAQAAEPLASSREMTSRISSLWNGFLM